MHINDPDGKRGVLVCDVHRWRPSCTSMVDVLLLNWSDLRELITNQNKYVIRIIK